MFPIVSRIQFVLSDSCFFVSLQVKARFHSKAQVKICSLISFYKNVSLIIPCPYSNCYGILSHLQEKPSSWLHAFFWAHVWLWAFQSKMTPFWRPYVLDGAHRGWVVFFWSLVMRLGHILTFNGQTFFMMMWIIVLSWVVYIFLQLLIML